MLNCIIFLKTTFFIYFISVFVVFGNLDLLLVKYENNQLFMNIFASKTDKFESKFLKIIKTIIDLGKVYLNNFVTFKKRLVLNKGQLK